VAIRQQPRDQRPVPSPDPPAARHAGADRRPVGLIVVLLVGVGLALAPVAFQMFSRAPGGGRMIDAFRPYMTRAEVTKLRGFLTEIGAAQHQARDTLDPAAAAQAGVTVAAYRHDSPFLAEFETRWPHIDADMTDMLDRMHANLGNYAAVDALPPFALFPWFFELPGLLLAGAAGWALVRRRRGDPRPAPLVALVVLGVGLVAAPFAFQMFSRAPQGGQMIDDFRPLMTRHKVTTIQGYFITIGNGEVSLAQQTQPPAASPAPVAAVDTFVRDWPRIDREMAPVVGVMSDNVDRFAGVDALPPFPLFPWFFVIPGLLVVVLAGLELRRTRRATTAAAATDPPSPRSEPTVSTLTEGEGGPHGSA